MSDIKLFVCCHQAGQSVPNHPLLYPIQVGAALAERHFPGFLHDDEGENISTKNRSYCELTAHYWAWKNMTADYYGFFHYRRYLYPGGEHSRPYRLESTLDEHTLQRLHFQQFADTVEGWDCLVPIRENMYIPVREHYATAPHHRAKDLELVCQIVRERYPQYVDGMQEYLSSTLCYFGNIFVMRREMLEDYCQWLFSILEEFDRRADVSGYTPQEARVDGYLAERLLGVYLTARRKDWKIKELPRVHTVVGGDGVKKKLLYAVAPPGTRRRFWLKRLLRG